MNSSLLSVLCRYRYDPLDRLTSHVQSDTPQRQRFYCKSRLATEIQGGIGFSIVQHSDFLLAQQQRESGSLDTRLLATDLQRSVLHTLKKDAEPRPIAYSPYGHRSTENGLTSLLGFNGERLDPVTGHYLLGNGYRAFNPVLMRFNSPDSLSPLGKGGLNPYTYCKGDPTNFTDDTGHIPTFLAKLFPKFTKTYKIAKLEQKSRLYTKHIATLRAYQVKIEKGMKKLQDEIFVADFSNAYAPHNQPMDSNGHIIGSILNDQHRLPLYERIGYQNSPYGGIDRHDSWTLHSLALGAEPLPKGITRSDAINYQKRLHTLSSGQLDGLYTRRHELMIKREAIDEKISIIRHQFLPLIGV